MSTDFDKYAVKGNEFLNLLSDELQASYDKTMRVLRTVLHATRNHLPLTESVQILAQLPMALRGIYVDQWQLNREIPRIHHIDQFLDEVRHCDKELAAYDFGNNESAANAVRSVYRTLHYYISDGEFEDLAAVLPAELREFILDSIGHNRMAL